jgi:N utilization substance protein B
MGLRRKSREIALQFLFGHDFQQQAGDPESVGKEFERFCANFDASAKALPYARGLITGICEQREKIDSQVKALSHHWRLERMSLVDRNILRIAIYEMKYGAEVPAKVAINEALEIAKHYSIPDSVAFINGILDGVELTPDK